MMQRLRAMKTRPEQMDAQLAERARSGDLEAFGTLYTRYAPGALTLAFRFMGERADAEDAVHDVFLGLPEALRRYDERGSFESWLKRLTVRVALTHMRANRRRREVALDADANLASASSAEGASGTLVLDREIRALPETLRTVFVLREIEGFSHSEIAATLGISRASSEVRLHRALRLLRTKLGSSQ